jgi:hypothetical protein
LCKRKNWNASQALHEEAWVQKLTNGAIISLKHLTQFVQLWALINNVHFHEDMEDDTRWSSRALPCLPLILSMIELRWKERPTCRTKLDVVGQQFCWAW